MKTLQERHREKRLIAEVFKVKRGYVKRLLKKQMGVDKIPNELIEAKKIELTILRNIKKLKYDKNAKSRK